MHFFLQKVQTQFKKGTQTALLKTASLTHKWATPEMFSEQTVLIQWKPCDLFSLRHRLCSHHDLVQLFVLLFTVVCPPQIPIFLRIKTMIVLFSVLSDHSTEPTEDARIDLGICDGAEDLLGCCCLHWNWPHQSLAISKIQRLGLHLPASLAAKRHCDWTSNVFSRDWGLTSVLACLASMPKALGSILAPAKQEDKYPAAI